MNWQFTPFFIPTLLATLTAGALALFAGRRRKFPGASEFQILMGAIFLWCLGYAWELVAGDLSTKNFAAHVKDFGVLLVSPAFLVFALKYAGENEWLSLRVFSLLAVEPILFLMLAWTNDFHGLIWSDIRLESFGVYRARITAYGPGFYGHAFYGYALWFLGSLLMLRTKFRRDSFYRGQGYYAVIAVLAAVLGNILYLSRLNPFRPFDLTPFFFVIAGTALALGLFRYQLLQVGPIAYEKIIRSMQDGFIVLDSLNRVLEMNQAFQNLCGSSPPQLIGKGVDEMFFSWPEFLEVCRQAAPGDSWNLPGPPGSRKYFDAQIISFPLSPELSAGRMLVFRDVTARVGAERELEQTRDDLERRVEDRTRELQAINQRLLEEVKERRKTQAILLESEERYRQLVEQPFDGVYVHRHGNIVYINQAGIRLLGGESDDPFIGRSILEWVHPDFREFVAKRIQEIADGVREVPLAEEKFVRLDGKVIDVEVAGSILMYEGLASTMVVFRDITERKSAEKKLRRAHDELEARVKERTADLEKSNLRLEVEISERKRAEEEMRQARDFAEAASRAKSDFLATMSHELRTPLNHIIGFTEMMTEKQFGPINETQEEHLNDVLESSRHLLGLINDILDLAKVEAGKMTLELERVPLKPLLEGSLVMVQERALKHRITLAAELGRLPDRVEVDPRRLKQILFNLLSNAVKFTLAGGRVTVKAGPLALAGEKPGENGLRSFSASRPGNGGRAESGDALLISVEDTGIGIRQEDLERIFNPFEQVSTPLNRRHNGTGLGLSLSRRMVELHGGWIWAESEGPDKGSAFRFVLPQHPILQEGKGLWTPKPS